MAGIEDNQLGLYISVPFCRSKCTYCNFASGVYPAKEHARYVERLIEDLRGSGRWADGLRVELPRSVDTIYLGGGTPSLLEPELIRRLFAAIRAEFAIEPDAEITVECAPGQIEDGTLDALVEVGVNRISLGVQSFIDREAQVSGRLHTRAAVLNDLRRLRAAGISNLSLDLIAGLAGQTFASWEESVAILIDCGVPHASVYMLEIDEESRLGREMLGGGARYHAGLVPSDDAIAQMYETAVERLERAGLKQYEISNFCRSGFQSRHNLRYWRRRPYLGLGLDASSMLRESTTEATGARHVLRCTMTDDLSAHLQGPQAAETSCLSPERQHEEAWFLGLRMNEGVAISNLRREFGAESVERAIEAVKELVDRELLTSDGETVKLTALGRLLSNDVFEQFLSMDAATSVIADVARVS